MKAKTATVFLPEKMSVEEVCRYLEISRSTLNRRIEAEALAPIPKPSYLKRQYKLMFHRSDVERLKSAGE